MSDKNLTQLIQLSSLNTGDLLYFVRPSSGANGDFSIQQNNLGFATQTGLNSVSGALQVQINGNSSYIPWVIKNSNFTGVIGNKYQIDCSASSVTMQLPNGMNTGDWIAAEDATLSFISNNFTITPASLGIGFKINNGSSNYVDSVIGDKLSIVAISTGYGVSIK